MDRTPCSVALKLGEVESFSNDTLSGKRRIAMDQHWKHFLPVYISSALLHPPGFPLHHPRVWRRIATSEATPGLSARNRDHTFPARTRVVGVQDPALGPPQAWLKSELMDRGVVEIEPDMTLVAVDGVVNAFRNRVDGRPVHLVLNPDRRLTDKDGMTTWDLRGKLVDGDLPDLTPVALSDEYWFSWKRFHPDTTLVRL